MSKRIVWIDYMKIIACTMVMVGHFYATFNGRCAAPTHLGLATAWVFDNFPKPFMIGNFWVFVFCILSGSLIGKKKFETWRGLFVESVLRYLRIAVPVFLIHCIVLLIGHTIGFSNQTIAHLYDNVWLTQFMTNLTLRNLIKSTILLNSGMVGPFWMLSHLFRGNLFVLFANFIDHKYLKDKGIFSLVVLVALLAYTFRNPDYLYIFATYSGAFIFRLKKNLFNIPLTILVVLCMMSLYYIPNVSSVLTIGNVEFQNFICALLFIFAVMNCKKMNCMKPSKLPLSSISFWIYLLHWPIVCVYSCFLIQQFQSYTLGFWIVFTTTVFGVILLSFVCAKTLDRWLGSLVKFAGQVMNKVLRLA